MMDNTIFGDTVDYDGVPLLCSGWATTDIETAHRLAAGLVGDYKRLIFREPDMAPVNGPPVRGQEVYLNDEAWLVEKVDRQVGMVIVDFYRDRG